MGRSKAIRKFCIECQNGSLKGVRTCNLDTCFLYPFRMGRVGRKTLQNALKTEKKVWVDTKLPVLNNNGLNDDIRAKAFLESLGYGKSMVEVERESLE